MNEQPSDKSCDAVYEPIPSWGRKFADSFRGIVIGIKGESSFRVHIPAAIAVILAGMVLQVSRIEWCLLVLCITSVLASELFNRAVELLAKAVDRRENAWIRDALDISSAAVSLTCAGAAAIGILVLAPHLTLLEIW